MMSSTNCSPGCARRKSRCVRRSWVCTGRCGRLRCTCAITCAGGDRRVPGRILAHCFAGHQVIKAFDEYFPPGSGWVRCSRSRGWPEDCDFRGGWHPPPLLGLDRRDLWSGECGTTGANVQILVLLDGRLFARALGLLFRDLCTTWGCLGRPSRSARGIGSLHGVRVRERVG